MCTHLDVSSSGYYDWLDRGESDRTRHDALLVDQIQRMHVGHEKNYGAIRVHPYLKGLNYVCSRRRINRLMKAHGIRSSYHAQRYRRYAVGSAPVADNLLAELPKANAVGQQWAGDMTYLKNELVHHWKFKTRVECVARIIDYIEFYNEIRFQQSWVRLRQALARN